ncbi:MAG: type II toxin-antitoxin system death-on-curing family toxin [Anaerolineaceae bacterium]
MIFLNQEDIVSYNKILVLTTGGDFYGDDNLINPGSLDWVLCAVQYPIFNINRFPTLQDKASIIAWTIITDHVFYDGNKRTGLFSLLKFLEFNYYEINVSSEEITQIALEIINYRNTKFDYQQLSKWVESNMKVIRRYKK